VSGELSDLRFCHLVVGVTDMDQALSFYRGLLGMDVVFDQLISGEAFDAALHASRQREGRVVGGVIGGLMIELLSLGGSKPAQAATRRGIVGIQNVSLSVTDLDDTFQRIKGVQLLIMGTLVAVLFVTLRPLENNPLPIWDGGFVSTPGGRSAAVGALLCLAGAATLASVGWGLKDQGLYCVAVMLVALVAARVVASDSQRVCAASLPARMT
jgi:catechol 2,3-dioxygenase-like lactoylglutathione lyase family enzyme